MIRSDSRTRNLLLGLFSLLFLIWSVLYIYGSSFIAWDGNRYFSLFDDAMIAMRYAFNLVEGHGLVWNEGEYVEGITNMLMTLLMTVHVLLFGKFGAIPAVQFTGALIILGIAFLTFRISYVLFDCDSKPHLKYLPVLCFLAPLSYYPLLFWSLMGMETGLVTLLLVAGTYLVLIGEADDRPNYLLAVLLGLAFWTRPDAAIPVAILMAFRGLGRLTGRRSLVPVIAESAVIALFVAALTGFRWFYYGSPVPNTYLLKVVGMPLAFRIENGLGFMQDYFSEMQWIIGFAILTVIFRFSSARLLVMLLFLANMSYQIWNGGDPWPYWRVTSPFTPFLFMLVMYGFFELAALSFMRPAIRDRLAGVRILPAERAVGLAGIAGAILLVLMANIRPDFRDQVMLRVVPYTAEKNVEHANLGLAVNRLAKSEATLGVFWAGTHSYFADVKTIDFLGKSDAHIASMLPDLSGAVSWNGMKSVPGHNKYDLAYSIGQLKPTFIQGYRWGREHMGNFVAQNYELVRYQGQPLLVLRNTDQIRRNLLE